MPRELRLYFQLFGEQFLPPQNIFTYLALTQLESPRPFAYTLADKTFIHYPNPIKGNKPINIGHCYSVVCALPDPIETEKVPWAVPLSGERVPSKKKGVNQGNQQLEKIWKSSSFSDKLAVLVAEA